MSAIRLTHQEARRVLRRDQSIHRTPPAPTVPAVICAVDPGVMHCGYAVLDGVEQLATSGTWIPRRTLSVLERHLWLLSQLQDLLTAWQPGILAYEEFVWQVGDNGEYFVRGRPALERLIGGIQTLTLWPPHPVLMPLLPQSWGRQLLGQAQHTKTQIAWAVNQRLQTSFKGDFFDNHQVDAIGIGLVALDNIKGQDYLQRYGKDDNAVQTSRRPTCKT